jgi:pimeloyl-[acyl-carrier protein] methyl ester esterase
MPDPEPKLVILPGIDGLPALRQGIAAALEGRFDVEVMALPDDPALDYPSMAQWFVERLPEGKLVLAGESFSGPLAALIAEECPDKVVGVAFIASFPRLALPGMLARLLDPLPLRAIPMGLLTWILMGSAGAGDLARQMRVALALMPERVVKRRARLALAIDVRETVRRLLQPILIVHGRQDRLVPFRIVRRFRKLRPDAQVVAVHGPHMILETHPEPVARALAAFIDLLGSRG